MQTTTPIEPVAPCLERAAFATESIPSGGVALAHLHGQDLDPAAVKVKGISAGFTAQVMSSQGRQRASQVIVVLRVSRIDGRAGESCTVRFWGGGRACDAALTVRR